MSLQFFPSMLHYHHTAGKRSSQKTKLPPDFVPGRYSVICGRGKLCSSSPGNKFLRSLVKSYLTPYSMAKNKAEKSAIVSAIVNRIRGLSPEGSFVKQEGMNGEWWEVDDAFAREKIGCIFRDILHTQYRSSTKAKQARKKASSEHQIVNNEGPQLDFWRRRRTVQEGFATNNTATPVGWDQSFIHVTGNFPSIQHHGAQGSLPAIQDYAGTNSYGDAGMVGSPSKIQFPLMLDNQNCTTRDWNSNGQPQSSSRTTNTICDSAAANQHTRQLDSNTKSARTLWKLEQDGCATSALLESLKCDGMTMQQQACDQQHHGKDWTIMRRQPRFDVFRDSNQRFHELTAGGDMKDLRFSHTGGSSNGVLKSSLSLLEGALGVVDMVNASKASEDMPDDLSDIFDDDTW